MRSLNSLTLLKLRSRCIHIRLDLFDMKRSELAFILWLISAVVQVLGKTRILLTRPEKESLWLWADYGNKNSNNKITGWKHPTTTTKFYSVCDVEARATPINWLRSYFIDVKDANRLLVTIEYNLRCPKDVNSCKTTFGLFVYHAENNANPPDPAKVSFSKVAEIASSSTPGAAPMSFVSNSTFATKKAGVYLALLDSGACFVVTRVTVSYQYCAEGGGVLVEFPETVAPANNSHLVEQTGKCTSDHSVKKTKLLAQCLSSGEWNSTDDVKCLCIQGYELVNGSSITYKCEECKPGLYKKKDDNSKCEPCPLHSIPNNNRTTCICNSGYYKRDNDIIVACQALPAAPRSVNNTSVDGTTVVISWKPSPSDKGHITYSVDCFKCKNQKDRNCEESCSRRVRYRPRKVNITEANVTVTGLSPVSYFLFRIYSVNDLNRREKDRDKWNYGQVFVKTEGEHVSPPVDGPEGVGMSKTLKMVLYIAVPVAAVAIILIIIIGIFCIWDRNRKGYNQPIEMKDGRVILPTDGQRLYVDPSNYDDPEEALRNFAKELDKKQITLEKVIGGGEFGEVYKGILTRPDEEPIPVAVKTLKATSRRKDRDDFLAEASIMGQFCDPNVIYLEGVVTKTLPLMIIIEFMSNGSLDNFLKSMDGKLSVLQLLGMARGVASGMKYLSDMNFVHRDLAARNVLVSESMVCKVADFGLSREVEDSAYETKGGKIPVRWTSPEAIDYRKFSWASDVWSYGILLWEIMSFGERPYWEWSNFQVIERVKDGYRLPPPAGNQEECPKSIHNIMLNCWDVDRNKRPTFTAIVKKLEYLIRSPDRLNEEPSVLRNGPNLQCSEKTSVKEWLESIKMGRYTDMFVKCGFRTLGQLVRLDDLDLNEVGVKLIGHKNKLRKSFREMKKGLLEETSVTSVSV